MRLLKNGAAVRELDRPAQDAGRDTQRRQRAVLDVLRTRDVTLAEVLELDVREVRLLRVAAVCAAWSGKTREHCALVLWNNLGISERHRVQNLGPWQRVRVVERFR